MQIAVNTRLLLPSRLDGIGWFSFESLRRIVTDHPEHQFFFLFDRKPAQEFIFADNVFPVVLFPQARHPLLWWLFFEWSVPYALRKYKIDLFVSTDGWMSLRTDVPTLTVMHDLNFEHADDYLRRSHQRYMKHFFPLFAAKATRIATVSQFSKTDISNVYGVSEDKIDVVYNGSNANYRPCSSEEIEQTKDRYSDGFPFFLFVGTLSRRKNLANILRAYEKFKQSHPNSDMRMVVAGSKYSIDSDLAETMQQMVYKDCVKFLGHVDSHTLAMLTGSSTALVYTSLFEGFGIPIIEAYNAETAVITSTVTSMPEVAGDAALLVDPLSVDDIADAMTRIADDDSLRSDLIQRGRIQRTLFSWDRTAALLWQSIMATYNDSINQKSISK